jgi:Short C-terminal domain
MPGLLRGIARTAVAAGTWTAVSNRVARHQYNKWSEQDAQAQYAQQPQYVQQPPQQYAQPAPSPAASPEDDRITKLKQLADLKAQGILTDQEFATEKARILNG